MKTLALMCLLLVIGTFSFSAQAQVAGCAPGDISYTGGGVSTCLPGNTQPPPEQQQAPTPLWQTRWGAIATDVSHGVIGSASNMQDEATAKNFAMTDCQTKGGTSCIMQGAFFNGCGVLISGKNGFNVSWGDSEATAVQKGLSICSANDTGCQVYFKTCSPAVRVR